MDIGDFLKLMTEKHASDLFMSTGAPVYTRVEGKPYPLDSTGLPPGMVRMIACSLTDERQIQQFERDFDLDMAYSLQDAAASPSTCSSSAARPRPRTSTSTC